MRPSEIIPKFDLFLKKRSLTFEGIVVGGAALEILGVITRETQDCDVLDPQIPEAILLAAKEFAGEVALPETSLKETWLNNGPASLVPQLPKGWRERIAPLFEGKALTLYCLARSDLLCTKLFALCDRGQDLSDCVALAPNRDELIASMSWVSRQDANPSWPKHVKDTFAHLAKRLGYEL